MKVKASVLGGCGQLTIGKEVEQAQSDSQGRFPRKCVATPCPLDHVRFLVDVKAVTTLMYLHVGFVGFGRSAGIPRPSCAESSEWMISEKPARKWSSYLFQSLVRLQISFLQLMNKYMSFISI